VEVLVLADGADVDGARGDAFQADDRVLPGCL
jgi:hypothetical protein